VKLARAEWSRLFARRFTRIMIGAILLILGLVALGLTLSTHRVTEADHVRAREEVAQQLRYHDQDQARVKAECERVQGTDAARRYPPDCDFGPTLAEMQAACQAAQQAGQGGVSEKYPPNCEFGPTESDFLPHVFNFRADFRPLMFVAAGILTLFGFVVGASFIGAEWTSGGMTNLLLWRPRRLPVLATKLATMLAGVTLISATYLAVWVGTFWLVAYTRGEFGRLTAGFWRSLALDGLRAAVLVLAAAAVGFALASLGRHTAMALGVGIAYALVVEIGTLIIFGILGTQFPLRFRLSTYIVAWLDKKVELFDQTPTCGPNGCVDVQKFVITWPWAGGLLLAGVVALVAAAFVAVRRRDVT
jgi:ABC-2 type transport system permease protein